MGFCLDHADAAADVMRTLKESLLTPLGPSATWKTKLARLYLVSDVLHNSSAPSRNASRYRALVQAALPEVFEALGAARLALESRLAREAFDARVSGLLAAWSAWSIYPPLFGVLIVYAIGGTIISIQIGKPLVEINFKQEKTEADYR